MSARARRDDDPLAGATIVVHDLSRSDAAASGAGSTGGRSSPASPAAPVNPLAAPPPAPGTPVPTPTPDRWRPLRGLLLLASGVMFGVYGYATWLGRPPTPLTLGTLGAAPKVEIRVQVDGAVLQPGVYRLAQGDRVEDAINAAGGLAPHADSAKLRLAERVRDEQRLDVPALIPNATGLAEISGNPSSPPSPAKVSGESGASSPGQPVPTTSAPLQGTTAARSTTTPRPQATARPTSTPRAQPTARATAFAGGKVNVNTATQAQLEQLPGFGPTSAQRILSYRATNGPLRSLDDVRKAGVQEQFVRQAADFLAFD